MSFLILLPPLTFTIPPVMPSQRKIRQPRFAAYRPTLISGLQLIGRIQRAEVHLDLVATTVEYR